MFTLTVSQVLKELIYGLDHCGGCFGLGWIDAFRRSIPFAEQQFCAALVPSAIGQYPGRQSALVLGIEICSGGRQKFDSLQVAMESGEMQRSCAPVRGGIDTHAAQIRTCGTTAYGSSLGK